MQILKQITLCEAGESEPEPTVCTISVLNSTEELRMTESGIRLSADTDCNEQRATATGQKVMRLFTFFLREGSEGKTNLL